MGKVSFLIVSVSDRVSELNKLIKTIKDDPRFNEYDLNIYFQDPLGVAGLIEHRDRIARLFVVPELMGCHGARVMLLRELAGAGYESYVNLDDDMELCKHTDYEPALAFSAGAGVGFVMTNWARTWSLLEKKVPAMLSARASGTGRFKPQIMLYNGGGMVYGERVAELIRDLEPVKTAFDCAWPITSYVNGLVNYRDQGSLAVHRVCGTGGMNAFMAATPLHVMCEQWLVFEPAKRQDGTCKSVKIPLDTHVRPEAKRAHRAARLAMAGGA
jgi:hypothetical protein